MIAITCLQMILSSWQQLYNPCRGLLLILMTGAFFEKEKCCAKKKKINVDNKTENGNLYTRVQEYYVPYKLKRGEQDD